MSSLRLSGAASPARRWGVGGGPVYVTCNHDDDEYDDEDDHHHDHDHDDHEVLFFRMAHIHLFPHEFAFNDSVHCAVFQYCLVFMIIILN